jgi:DNA repair exonuclease SbcCD ATPase subunit
MFDVVSIGLWNFRSFRGSCRFDLPKAPGLYNIAGLNLDNPRLDPNGVGKSTLLEALCWCLFGKTTRGLRGTDVISWGEKSCYVSVDCGKYGIQRQQGPNKLVMGDQSIDQGAIEQKLRLGFEAFKHSIMFPQFHQAFFDLPPSEKLSLFSDIMELEFWLDKSKAAEVKAKGLTAAQVTIEQSIARYDGQLSLIAEDVKGLKVKEHKFEATQNTEIKRLGGKAEQTATTLKKAQADLKAATGACDNARKRLEAAERQSGSVCPTCKQPVKSPDIEHYLSVLRKNHTDFTDSVQRFTSEANNCKRDLAELVEKIHSEAARENPYAEMVKGKVRERLELKAKLEQYKGELEQLLQEQAAYSYWVGGFKRLRLMVVEEALNKLEIEVNNNLASLGLTDWRVEFDVERENKSGGVTRGFVVLIHAPGQAQPVRWEAWSGGETQRLRLAGNLGLADLIMESAGVTSSVEFYDEPSLYLGQQGLLDLAETLHDRALREGKRIFLIEHNLADYAFTGTITVQKSKHRAIIT